jgi:uncharacterized protein with FMN-binding domain
METEPETKSSSARNVVASIIVVVVIAAMVIGIKLLSNKKSDQSVASNTGTSSGFGTSSTGSGSSSSSSFKDGSYTATGDYDSPGGSESITVSVTLKNSVITATSAQSGANDSTADMFQSDFIQGYKSLVVGKSISSVNLSKVSGSSLTSQGFNEAITKIENQAKA